MGWFVGAFLPSIDKKFNDGKSEAWLTENQVNVCRRYMKQCEYFTGFYIVVGDYQYTLHIMKKGYGRMTRADRRIACH